MKEETILALMVAPGSRPCLTILKNELDALQKAVSIGAPYQGYIEVLSLEDDVCLICNEEAKLISLPGNRRIGRDIIAGAFYIVGDQFQIVGLIPALSFVIARLDFRNPFSPRNDAIDLRKKFFFLRPYIRQSIAERGQRYLLIHT